jgi:hypothetical protein
MGYRGMLASAVLALAATGVVAQTKSPWPANAKVFFIEPQNGATVSSPVKVKMGATGVEVVPAGTEKPNSGHHHILINTDPPKGEAATFGLPMDDKNRHFGKGQTETELTLPPGKHTLQLVFGDAGHVPYDPPLASEKITITVK